MLENLKNRAKILKNEIFAISLAIKDKRTPLPAKILIFLTVSYALSPIDLIPDFIPVLGYIDDLIILPFMITISIKMIPEVILDDCRKRISGNDQLNKNIGLIAASVIILLWLLIIGSVALNIF